MSTNIGKHDVYMQTFGSEWEAWKEAEVRRVMVIMYLEKIVQNVDPYQPMEHPDMKHQQLLTKLREV